MFDLLKIYPSSSNGWASYAVHACGKRIGYNCNMKAPDIIYFLNQNNSFE